LESPSAVAAIVAGYGLVEMSLENLERLVHDLSDGLKTFDSFIEFGLRGRVLGCKPRGEGE
jgi:hypothetical protein